MNNEQSKKNWPPQIKQFPCGEEKVWPKILRVESALYASGAHTKSKKNNGKGGS